MSNILTVAFPKRLNDLKLCIYYQGATEPPRELMIALDDVIYGGIKDTIPTHLLNLNVCNYKLQQDGFHSVDIILKLNNSHETTTWLKTNIDTWDSISKAFNGTFNYRRIVELTTKTNNVIQIKSQ